MKAGLQWNNNSLEQNNSKAHRADSIFVESEAKHID